MEKQQTKYSEALKIPKASILEDDNWCDEYKDDNLSECLMLTLGPMPCLRKPAVELKTLPKDLRYEFLDTKLKQTIIVNAAFG